MSRFLAPILWLVAIIVALVILRRVRRGEFVVLRGKYGHRLIRMIVVVLVVLGAGGDERTGSAAMAFPLVPLADPSKDDPLPAKVTMETITSWHRLRGIEWHVQEKKALAVLATNTKLPPATLTAYQKLFATPGSDPIGKMLRNEGVAILEAKTPPTMSIAEITLVLDTIEQYGGYDHYFTSFLWRKTAAFKEDIDPKALTTLYARLREHARITDALLKAHSQVRPPFRAPHAWMSKAGPRPGDRAAIEAYLLNMRDMHRVAQEVYPTIDEGTWKRDGQMQISAVRGEPAPRVVTGGKSRVLPEVDKTRFGRLNLLETGAKPCKIEHEWLGTIELPADRTLSVWDLPRYLPDAARDKLDRTIKEALEDKEEAAQKLERVLPLAHSQLRVALQKNPDAKGSPKLRLILSLFDDVIMPELPPEKNSDPLRGPAGPGRQ